MGGTTEVVENARLREEEMGEFNKPTQYKDDLHGLQGSDNEKGHPYVDFNEKEDVKNPHFTTRKRTYSGGKICHYRSADSQLATKSFITIFVFCNKFTLLLLFYLLGLELHNDM